MRLVVDVLNVVGARPTGWWRDRDAAVLRFVWALVRWGPPAMAVIDGRPIEGLPQGRHGDVDVVYADRPGPGAADDRIVALVAAAPDPAALLVVTSDRELGARVRAVGADVRGARWLLDELGDQAERTVRKVTE